MCVEQTNRIYHFKLIIISNSYLQKLITAHRNKRWHRIFPRKYRKFDGEIRQNCECHGWNDTGAMPIDGQNGSYLLKLYDLFFLLPFNNQIDYWLVM